MNSRTLYSLLTASIGMGMTFPTMVKASDIYSAPPVPVQATNYLIAPADVIGVNVVNFANLSVPQTIVSPDGTVTLPLIDTVTVTGKTTTQLSALLTQKFRRFLVHPAVSVSLVQKHPQLIVFSGFLNKTGSLEYRPGMHLIDALAEAGGAIPEKSNPSAATVTHVDGTKQTFDLSYPETKKGTDIDIELQPGDVVYIPEQLAKVSVVGEVKQQGSLIWNDHLTVLEAITASGGYLPDTADLKAAKLTHDDVEKPIDLYAMLKNGDMTNNVKLAPGDRLVIPKLYNKVYIFGDVAKPGFYYFEIGDRIADALSGAGGPTPQADLGKVNVIKTDKEKNKADMSRVCLNDFLLHGDLTGNPMIGPGDALYIPDKKKTFSLNDIFGAFNTAGSIAYTTRVLQNK